MSVIGSNILAGASGQGGDYTIARSLRFRKSATAYLSKTFGSAGNQQVMTFSTWVKRGVLGASGINASGYSGGGGTQGGGYIYFGGGDAFSVLQQTNNSTDYELVTTQVFRDPSAWYHIVIAIDTTQATASNRIKLYVNGSQVTAFSTSSYPSQNSNTKFNATNQRIAAIDDAGSAYLPLDGYLAEYNFIDGQALTPSSFGQTSATTGVWQPKKYAGTYGTNGFYLPFSDNASTTTLGNDFSGNGNNWTTNNISLTAGSTYDSMTDVPTLTSATAANYCVMNPLDQISTTVTNGNLQSVSGAGGTPTIRGTIGVSSGKYYWEVLYSAGTSNACHIGVADSTATLSTTNSTGANSWNYYGVNGNKFNNGTGTAYGASYTTGDVIGVALDMDAGTLTFYKNNTSQGTAFTGLTGKTLTPNLGNGTGGGTQTFQTNFGQRPFAYTPPTGFVALNTFNLPTPTIGATASTQANKYFDISLYTGNNSTQTISGLGFAPNFVWTKTRANAYGHDLYNIVTGINKRLQTNNTNAENTTSDTLTAFNSDGFTLGVNDNSNYVGSSVAWSWAGGGTGVSNTAGTRTSTVSANTSSGFSVVTYSGNSTRTITVGHGLGVAPSMIIIKNRTTADTNWTIYHSSLGANKYLNFNTSAEQTSTDTWNNTSPTSTVFSLGDTTSANGNGDNLVAYCFSEVAGYSKFGSFTGNGSTDGTFVALPFKPKYVMIKKSSSTGNWIIFDGARVPYNLDGSYLYANSSDAEGTSTTLGLDLLSNGFKNRNAYTDANASGATYIYMAFAEVPQKFSLGV
jgi:hypothetical protein